LTYKTLKK